MLQAIIAWQVYAISGSALDLGIVGLVRFTPALALSLISGVIVDTYDRQRILLAAQAVPVITSGLMLAAIATGRVSLPLVYGLVFMAWLGVVSGGPKALLPICAVDLLHADAAGYGLLTASLDVGALLAAMLMVALPTPTRTGRALLASVAAFGLATIAFGLSRSLALSILAYAAVGAADQVSVVMRLNTIQLTIPDELRGRITAVNFVFVNASNQIGGLESGVVAALTNAMFAVVSGGVACVAVVAFVTWRVPALRNHQRRLSGL